MSIVDRRTIVFGLVALPIALNAQAREAGGYPSRPIKIVVPFPPGTPSEFVIRALADRLSRRFGQAVVIENRPGGAGGTLGAKIVSGTRPDGYTLLASPPSPLVTAAAIYNDLGYDPEKSFSPIALLFESPQILAVNPQLPVNSLHELVAYARANPNRLSFASPGYGTQPHLIGEMLKTSANIKMVHVPYKGPARALNDLLTGQVQLYFETSTLILPLAETGRLKVLAVASTKRVPQLPNVPTTAESEFPDLTGAFWSGVVAPAGTPSEIIRELNIAINDAMQASEIQSGLARLGGRARLGTPEEFAEYISMKRAKWMSVISERRLKIGQQ